jgi:hypothetical protein
MDIFSAFLRNNQLSACRVCARPPVSRMSKKLINSADRQALVEIKHICFRF